MPTNERSRVEPRWSLVVARLFGIEVRVHATLAILLIWVFLTQLADSRSLQAASSSLLLTVLVFGTIVLHELAHALTARRFGIHTLRITLWPIGGIAHLSRLPERPSQELAVALAGPALNLVLAGLLAVAASGLGWPITVDQLGVVGGALVAKLLWINLAMAGFNLLPAFPMDGGRVLRAVLAFRLDRDRATDLAAAVGKAMAGAFAIAGLFFAPTLLLIAVFVWFGASAEAGQARLAHLLEGVRARDVMVTQFEALALDLPLGLAASRLARGFQRHFPVVDGEKVVGLLTPDDVRRGLEERGAASAIRQSMHGRFPSAQSGEPLATVLERLSEADCGVVTVIDEGKPVGLVTLDQLAQLFSSPAPIRPPKETIRSAARF